MLVDPSYVELARACRKYIPEHRLLHEIHGTTGTSLEDSEVVTLTEDEEVEAWLLDTVHVHPLQVLAILKKTHPRITMVGLQPAHLTERGGAANAGI